MDFIAPFLLVGLRYIGHGHPPVEPIQRHEWLVEMVDTGTHGVLLGHSIHWYKRLVHTLASRRPLSHTAYGAAMSVHWHDRLIGTLARRRSSRHAIHGRCESVHGTEG
jgi:hypothetical protein